MPVPHITKTNQSGPEDRAPSDHDKPGVWLFAAAAPKEARAVMDGLGIAGDIPDEWALAGGGGRFEVVRTGVGKSNAAGAVARVLDPRKHRGVISVGIAGSLPGSGLSIGDSICGTGSVFADEGVGTDGGFISMRDLGFGPFPGGAMGADHDPALVNLLSGVCDAAGPVATVSWCSGSDGCAAGVVQRTGALAEAMEGAAVALAARRVAGGAKSTILTGEVRVISNTTGERDAQRWDLDGALGELASVLGRMAGVLG